MNLNDLEKIAQKFADELDPVIGEKLEEVEILVVQSVHDASQLMTDSGDLDNGESLPGNMKGEFVGFPLEVEDGDGEGEGTIVNDAEGEIYLVADNIADPKEAALVLTHEVGHALGMSEEEVTQLGLGVAKAAPAEKADESQANS